MQEHDSTPGALNYGLQAPNGRPVAGLLAEANAPMGWSAFRIPRKGGGVKTIRLLTVALPNSYRLLVGDDADRIDALDAVMVRSFALALAGVVLLGGAGGYVLSRGVRRRYGEITAVAEAIIEGDLARRAPVRGVADDLDHLALTINRMLDWIGELMESLRQVSSDIAHDMRTPLTRLRQRLEAAQRSSDPAELAAAVEGALSDLDAILETFAGLLRIAEIERGARRAAFRPVDLAAVARMVVETFAPSAEEGGRTLELESEGSVTVEGDQELIGQMLVNLVENGLRHTPVGSVIRVGVDRAAYAPMLRVTDNGPGVPQAERDRLFDRFYRLERSRSTPGSGLGLALAAAVAHLHGAQISLADAGPGLEAQVRFPPAA